MKKQIFTVLLAFAFGLGITLIASTESMAVHKGSTGLTCGSCHTMHSSQGNATMGNSTGSLRLIRGAASGATKTAELCLTCHADNGGSGDKQFNTSVWLTTPPKVYIDTKAGSGNSAASGVLDAAVPFTKIGAGGDFSAVGTFAAGLWTLNAADTGGAGAASLGKGHSIEETQANALPPGNNVTGVSVGGLLSGLTPFTCTSCHDAHGTTVTTNGINFFRNLKADTNNRGANAWTDMSTYGDLAKTYVGAAGGTAATGSAIAAATNIWPVIDAGLTTQNVYTYKNAAVTLNGKGFGAVANVGISAFCAQCHGAWHEKLADGAGTWLSSNTNGANDWNRHPVNNFLNDSDQLSGSGSQIIDVTNYGAAGVGLPTANATTSTVYYLDTQLTSKVFCLSCHFAHGGPYNDGLRWDHTSAVSSGSQIGVALLNTVGCQQCHNK